MTNHTQPSQQVPVAKPGVITTAEELIALLRSCKPEYGTVGSRDCDVTTKRAQIDEAISRLEKYIAPDAGLAKDAKRFLQQDDLDALCRINANFEDGEGYMETKETMNRLAEIGVVSSTGFGRYFVTAFGSLCLNERGLPLRTSAEHNKREAEGLMLYNKDGFNGTAWINLSEESRETWRERAALGSQEPQHG